MTSFLRQPAAFTVTGRGDFPFDMLRHDRCYPATGEDAAKLERPEGRLRDTHRAIRLVATQYADITPGRWESFGWAVHDISESWGEGTSDFAVRQEVSGRWSVYQGLAFLKGGFVLKAEAEEWMADHIHDTMQFVRVPA